MRFVPFMKEARFWVFIVLCGSGLLALVAGAAALQECPIPVAATAANALALIACLATLAFALVSACLHETDRRGIGRLSGQLENPWEVGYQEQLASTMIRERQVG